MPTTLILGAGLSGLSASYHLAHKDCISLEKNEYPFGHLHSELRDGFRWDEGPHVSFTKHAYVRDLFAENVNGSFEEYPVQTINYFRGHWINHPAQSSLYQIPEPLRSQCLDAFIAARKNPSDSAPSNYQEWLDLAFGSVFSNTFPAAYTRKYWTREPRDLATEWVGQRVFNPNVDDVIAGAKGPISRQTHYITTVRYPTEGGFQSFVKKLAAGADIRHGFHVCRIDLAARRVYSSDGRSLPYDRLINTLPLPLFISFCADTPLEVRDAALNLSCSQLLLVNAIAPHPTKRPENWMYVYDEDKYATRINCTELLSPHNAPAGWTGVQTEVYFSRHKPLREEPSAIGQKVLAELGEMGLIDPTLASHHMKYSPWANVIFDLSTRSCLDTVWRWLETKGLLREDDDLEPLTDWNTQTSPPRLGQLIMAGRFGQWKYFWTDDCTLRGRAIGQADTL